MILSVQELQFYLYNTIMFRLKSVIPYLIIIIFSLYVCWPLLQPGFYTMHDDEQIGRLYDLDLALKSGQFPPRIVPNLGFGYGYPFFNFYPPFAYYVGEVFHLMGFSLITSTKLLIGTGFLLSAIFMYLFAKQFFGRLGGMLSAISYTLLSYKAVDVYVRGAYAEFFAFVPIPMLFLSVWKIGQGKRSWYLLWNALSAAVLILSHNLIALMSVPFLGSWILFVLWRCKDKLRFFLEVSSSFVIGFLLSAYFFVPSYLERGQTLVNILTTELASYSIHFVCTYQLWDSMWGYGGSIPSCFDGVSFEVGKVQLILSFIVFIFALYKLIRRTKEKATYIAIILNSVLLGLSLFLMVKFSRPVWDALPPFWYIQFPWRFLLFGGFFASFMTGGALLFSKNKYVRLGIVLVVLVLLLYFSRGRFMPQRQFNADDSFYTTPLKIRWETSGLAYEYVPKGITTYKSELDTTKVDIEVSEIASSSSEVISGEMEVTENKNLPHIKEFDVNVHKAGKFQINTFSFPGWEVFVDGKSVNYEDSNKFKLIRISLSPGSYNIRANYTNTPPRMYGNIASILGIIGIVILVWYITSFKNYGKKTS